MLDKELINICMGRYKKADNYTETVQFERQKALKYYNTEPFGDEKDGESQFITSDVRDTIEWMLPQTIEPFITGGAFEFTAKNADDVKQAELETSYVDHVYNEQNEGFLNTYTWVKDGLLGKNGVAKIYWDEKVDEVEEDYEGLDILAFQKILSDPDVEIEEATAQVGEQEFTLAEIEAQPELAQVAKFDVKAIRKEDNSIARVKIIAPENFLVEEGLSSLDLDTANFLCHRDTVTYSDLIVDGYSKALVDTIPTGDEAELDEEATERHDETASDDDADDVPSQKITIYECYIRVDYDGDGKAELRMVKLAGPTGSVILENEIVDGNPFAVWTPVINCHKFYGMSYADLIMDIQKLRSTIWRQTLNNLYMVNHPAKGIIENQVYKEDLLYTGPGAIYRMKSPDAIVNLTTPFVGESSLPVLSMVEEMRQDRTGVSRTSQGLDPKALADSTNDIGATIMTQALQRIRMVSRIFAETGFKTAMLKLHALCQKHDSKRDFNLSGEWSQVDPREWAKRSRYKCKVGVGHADKMERMRGISMIVQNQKEIASVAGVEGPVLGADNLHAALVEQAKLLGFVDGEKYYRDPKTYQPAPSGPSEAIQITEATTVADLTKSKASNEVDLKKHDDDTQLKKYIADQNYDLGLRKLEQEKELKREELVLSYGTKSGSKVGFEDARNNQG